MSNQTMQTNGTVKITGPDDVRNKLVTASFISPVSSGGNPWSPEDVDKMEIMNVKEYKQVVNACRFFYRRDPLASAVINKLVDISINDITFNTNGLTANEMRIFEGIEPALVEFAEAMALEYLISGLVIPEVSYTAVTKDDLKVLGIKKYEALTLPTSMWLRDPETITIKSPLIGDEVSYYVNIPDEVIFFVMNNGKYPDGTIDKDLYNKLKVEYPAFISTIKAGSRVVLLDNDNVFRRRVLTDSPYPTPYLYPALEALKHKRNLRRMDYAIAARVIGAIQLFRLGNDEFPVTEGDEDTFDFIKSQMLWRESNNKDVERIYQLFANHTLDISWVVPPADALLDDTKYVNVNKDIIYALGMPQILIVGETERSASGGTNELALFSPERTMEAFRRKIVTVLNEICFEVSKYNRLKSAPTVEFRPLNLVKYADFVRGLLSLFDTKNVSRKSIAEFFGYNWEDEVNRLSDEEKIMKDLGLVEEPEEPEPVNDNPDMANSPKNNKLEPVKERLKPGTNVRPKVNLETEE